MKKKYVSYCGILIGIVAYTYLIGMTINGSGDGLSFSTFALWSTLGWITMATMLKHGANPAIPTVYATGSLIITITLVCKGKFCWSLMDTVVSLMVAVCVVLWLTRGPRWALVMSVLAGMVAGTPFLIMTWQYPQQSPIIPNLGALIANLMCFIGAESWKLEHKLYPGANTLLMFLYVLPWAIY